MHWHRKTRRRKIVQKRMANFRLVEDRYFDKSLIDPVVEKWTFWPSDSAMALVNNKRFDDFLASDRAPISMECIQKNSQVHPKPMNLALNSTWETFSVSGGRAIEDSPS